jgi:hypothetical protein
MPDQPADLPFSTPDRDKPLSVKRAESKARRALRWGPRVEAARSAGPAEVAVVEFDWTRASFKRLSGPDAVKAWAALAEALARVREEHAQ